MSPIHTACTTIISILHLLHTLYIPLWFPFLTDRPYNMVELRKRKASAQLDIAKTKKRGKKEEIPFSDGQTGKTNNTTNADSLAGVPNVGETITLDGFGGEIQTNDGTKTNLKELVATSKSGVVIFTYPRASTPGCKYIPPES